MKTRILAAAAGAAIAAMATSNVLACAGAVSLHRSYRIVEASGQVLIVPLGGRERASADVRVYVRTRPGEQSLRAGSTGAARTSVVLGRAGRFRTATFRILGGGTARISVNVIGASGKVVRSIRHTIHVKYVSPPRC